MSVTINRNWAQANDNCAQAIEVLLTIKGTEKQVNTIKGYIERYLKGDRSKALYELMMQDFDI